MFAERCFEWAREINPSQPLAKNAGNVPGYYIYYPEVSAIEVECILRSRPTQTNVQHMFQKYSSRIDL